jgi:hypothetical protein
MKQTGDIAAVLIEPCRLTDCLGAPCGIAAMITPLPGICGKTFFQQTFRLFSGWNSNYVTHGIILT